MRTAPGPWRTWGRLALVGAAALAAAAVALNLGGIRQRFAEGQAEATVRSLAVLPMTNLSHDPEQEYFADGMTEALTTELAQFRGLKVISRTSAMQYKGVRKALPVIARELEVDGIIEGSVQRSGDQVTITRAADPGSVRPAPVGARLRARRPRRACPRARGGPGRGGRTSTSAHAGPAVTPGDRTRRPPGGAPVLPEGPLRLRAVDAGGHAAGSRVLPRGDPSRSGLRAGVRGACRHVRVRLRSAAAEGSPSAGACHGRQGSVARRLGRRGARGARPGEVPRGAGLGRRRGGVPQGYRTEPKLRRGAPHVPPIS